jgi:hypothetical protein
MGKQSRLALDGFADRCPWSVDQGLDNDFLPCA